jgi:hypothetical protein
LNGWNDWNDHFVVFCAQLTGYRRGYVSGPLFENLELRTFLQHRTGGEAVFNGGQSSVIMKCLSASADDGRAASEPSSCADERLVGKDESE